MTARNLAAGEVVEALRANNLQIASGALNQQPVPTSGAFQLSVETVGRLLDPQQFADIVVKTDAHGRVTRVRDVARGELRAHDYPPVGFLDTAGTLPNRLIQRPLPPALATPKRPDNRSNG